MLGRFSKGFFTGGLMGAAAGMLIFPQLDMRKRRRISRTGRRIASRASGIFEHMRR